MKAPRTGGTSILRHTLERMPLDVFHVKDQPARFRAWLSQLTDADLESYFIFTFVRNPWERAVSIASYFGIPFQQFLSNYEELVRYDHNLFCHSLPLHRYTHMGDQLFVDFVGRFEALQADFDRVCRLLDQQPQTLPLTSQSEHGTYLDYYDAAAVERARAIYGRDADCFGYCFGEVVCEIVKEHLIQAARSRLPGQR